jgi:hypothetical protein
VDTRKAIADSYIQIQMPVRDAVHMDTPYLDGLVDGQGIQFEHWRAMPCPIGKDDPYDSRRVHDCSVGCSNGNVYMHAGDITAAFTGNSKSIQALDMGLVTGASAQLTLPRFYDSDPNKEVAVAIADRLFLKQNVGTVVASHLFEHNIGGMDRLKYRAVMVEHLMDSHGKQYAQNEHFTLVSGQLKWLGTNQPGMDPETRKGEVCSIRYRYIPFWYIDRLLHEIRVLRNGPNVARAPMSVLIQREYFYEDEQRSKDARQSTRQVAAPRDGSFGPR